LVEKATPVSAAPFRVWIFRRGRGARTLKSAALNDVFVYLRVA
jgi:hypothetical protein